MLHRILNLKNKKFIEFKWLNIDKKYIEKMSLPLIQINGKCEVPIQIKSLA